MNQNEILSETLNAIDEAKVPDDLRAVAFGKVFDLLAQRDGDTTASAQPAIKRDGAAPEVHDGNEPLNKIAVRLGVPLDAIEQVYAIDGESLELVFPAGKLKQSKSHATEQIALLVAGGRQASGIDSDGWTSVDVIREWCEHYKKNDASNFATTIQKMNTIVTVRGNGRDRKIKMTNPAFSQVAELVRGVSSGPQV